VRFYEGCRAFQLPRTAAQCLRNTNTDCIAMSLNSARRNTVGRRRLLWAGPPLPKPVDGHDGGGGSICGFRRRGGGVSIGVSPRDDTCAGAAKTCAAGVGVAAAAARRRPSGGCGTGGCIVESILQAIGVVCPAAHVHAVRVKYKVSTSRQRGGGGGGGARAKEEHTRVG